MEVVSYQRTRVFCVGSRYFVVFIVFSFAGWKAKTKISLLVDDLKLLWNYRVLLNLTTNCITRGISGNTIKNGCDKVLTTFA